MPARDPDMSRPWSIGLLVHDLSNPAGTTCRAQVAHWVVGMTLSGRVRYHGAGGAIMELAPGDLSLVRVRAPQHWQVLEGPWRVVYAVFDPRPLWLPWLDWPECMPGHACLHLDGRRRTAAAAAFRRAHDAWNDSAVDATDRSYHAVEAVLLTCQAQRRGSAVPSGDARVAAALELLGGDLAADLPLPRLAARVGLSRTQLAHLFRHQIGCGPMAWRAQRRLAHARQLLQAAYISVKQVAAMSGFADAKHFSTAFRRHTGCSPQAFRRRATAGA